MRFEIKSNVPLTDGFTNYFFKITDQPSEGLAYVPDSAKVTVGGDSKDVIAAPTAPTPVQDKVYFDQGNGYIGFTFPNVKAYAYNAPIVITYDMKVVHTGPQKNLARVDWSSNTANQPGSSCIADPASNCGDTQHADMNGVSFTSYYLEFKSVDGSKKNAPVGGEHFKVYRKGSKKPLKFRKCADGSYVYHPAEDASSKPTDELVAGTGKQTANGGEDLGMLKLDGLPPGIYTVEETDPPSSAPNAALVDFDVKITEDPANNGGAYVSIVRDGTDGLVDKPVPTADHLGAVITLNVTKAPEGAIDNVTHEINHVINNVVAPIIGNGAGNGTGSNGSGPLSVLATTGISVVGLLVLLCALVIVGTALMRRRHRIQR